ncbi:MAG TPA: disulfide bond formation protein B [Reyranella sp.]|jgi:disulfide bond formation protein DsbB|uniref:disulfide bond formation protein B n=2 Tax=Reyranella sp. TaxID=1929291 RepID=UPI00269EB000|nr:disulfide bond formation protein B [Reyranella sp.]HQS14757.1 disulfide bond formation protein B [Reyranella sp.]HQT14144.1 disulfide bond formation protein B [Reyranella sp.]
MRGLRIEASTLVMLDRLILLLLTVILSGILTAALLMQFAFGEIPCPLCLLQRVATFGCCFGLLHQLRARESERGGGIALLFAVLLLVIAARQSLLDLVPRPGHAYIGTAVFGLHMPVWSVLIGVALLLALSLRLTLFGGPRVPPEAARLPLVRATRLLEFYVVLICAINFASVVLQCGLGECHTSGYRLLT